MLLFGYDKPANYPQRTMAADFRFGPSRVIGRRWLATGKSQDLKKYVR
jgi:hypothetical protein